MKIYAFDDGYGDGKCATDTDIFLLPSFCSTFRPKPVDEFHQINQKEQYSYLAAEVNGQKYIVGQCASDLDENISWNGGINKHQDWQFPILLKTSLGLMAKTHRETVDMLVMGLPNKNYTKDRISLLEELICNKPHHIKLSMDGVDFFEREISVKQIEVKRQPFGSLCDLILCEEGELVNKDLARKFVVVADIGARTFNIYTSNALEPVPDLTTHTNDGMYTAFQNIANIIEEELQFSVPDGKIPGIIKKGHINGIDLGPAISQSYRMLAQKIKSALDKKLINSWAFVEMIVFTGGGSELLKPYLLPMFSDRKVMFLNRFSTVRGLRKYGVRQYKKTNKQPPAKVYIKAGGIRHE